MRLRKNSQTSNQKIPAGVVAVLASPLTKLVGMLICLSIGVYFISRLFSVFTVRCTLDGQPCPAELSSYAEHFVGQPLFGVDYGHVLQTTPYSVPLNINTIQKQLPNTLYVDFHIPPVAYQLQSGERSISVTDTGAAFENPALTAPLTIYTTVAPEELMTPNQTLQPTIHACITTLQTSLTRYNFKRGKLSWVDKDTITLIMDGEQQIIFLDCAAIGTQVAKLSLLLSSTEYREKQATVKEIDMRFDLPVLRMQQ